MKFSFVVSAAVLALAAWPGLAFAADGDDLVPHSDPRVEIDGYMRVRAEALNNLDLDRGPTPSGQPLFPVSQSDPTAQTLTYGDMRLRTDLAMYAPGGLVAVKARIDALDNIPLGGNADGLPMLSTRQLSPPGAMRVKRAYGEAKTLLGYVAAGRMGFHWGMGMLANSGDCIDCDRGDSADRITYVTTVFDHLVSASYDFATVGPIVPRTNNVRFVDIEPSTKAHTLTFYVVHSRDDFARARRNRAGKTTFDYGAYIAHRWQNNDVVPASTTGEPVQPIGGNQISARGYTATSTDLWLRVTTPFFRAQTEWALILANIDQPSLIPGISYRDPVRSRQLGGAIETDFGRLGGILTGGLDGGYASGDSAPGFGAFPNPNAVPRRGDLDGLQVSLPRDARIDNFRFSPDFRIDRILFREIIGTVTDAVYLRPHVRWNVYQPASGTFSAELFGVASWAVSPESTPGGRTPLGLEIDPTLRYESKDGFGAAIEYAALFPLGGLDNPILAMGAKPAQLFRVRLSYRF